MSEKFKNRMSSSAWLICLIFLLSAWWSIPVLDHVYRLSIKKETEFLKTLKYVYSTVFKEIKISVEEINSGTRIWR